MGMARYLVEAHLLEGRPVAELAASHGVHRSWIYKLIARYRAEGEAGLARRSRRPRCSPSKTPDAFVSEILQLRKQLSKDGFDAGAQTIHTHLQREHEQVPSAATIWRVLKAQGLVTPQPHKRPRSSYVRFCAELPNECWQSDITCWGEVEIVGVIDDHSRLCVAAKAFAQVKAPDVVATFYEAASRYGLPESLLSDNGAVYTAAPRNGRCAIESELVALGILYKHSRPYHPQTCGKVERFHRYLRGNFHVPLSSWLKQSGMVLDVDTVNAELGKWLRDVANQRVHPVTGAAPITLFEQRERALLRELPMFADR